MCLFASSLRHDVQGKMYQVPGVFVIEKFFEVVAYTDSSVYMETWMTFWRAHVEVCRMIYHGAWWPLLELLSRHPLGHCKVNHYDDVIMSAIASQITSLMIVYSTVYSGTDETKHQSSASLAFVRGIHRWPVNSPHKGPVRRKMFPFDDVIMIDHLRIG